MAKTMREPMTPVVAAVRGRLRPLGIHLSAEALNDIITAVLDNLDREAMAKALKPTLDHYSITVYVGNDPCLLIDDRTEEVIFEGGYDECQVELWKLGMQDALAAVRPCPAGGREGAEWVNRITTPRCNCRRARPAATAATSNAHASGLSATCRPARHATGGQAGSAA